MQGRPDRAVWVRVLTGDSVLSSWARHLGKILPQCLSTPRCINGYRRSLIQDWLASHPGGSRNTPSRFCRYRNQDKLWPYGPLDSYVDLTCLSHLLSSNDSSYWRISLNLYNLLQPTLNFSILRPGWMVPTLNSTQWIYGTGSENRALAFLGHVLRFS